MDREKAKCIKAYLKRPANERKELEAEYRSLKTKYQMEVSFSDAAAGTDRDLDSYIVEVIQKISKDIMPKHILFPFEFEGLVHYVHEYADDKSVLGYIKIFFLKLILIFV